MLWNTVLWSTVKSAKLTLASRIRQMHMHKLSQDQRKEKVCVMATSISESFWVCYWVHVLNLSHLRCQQTIGLLNFFFFFKLVCPAVPVSVNTSCLASSQSWPAVESGNLERQTLGKGRGGEWLLKNKPENKNKNNKKGCINTAFDWERFILFLPSCEMFCVKEIQFSELLRVCYQK